MRGFIDLHCHYVPGVDDGVRTQDDAVALLRNLGEVGFEHVVATPHIRPGMFDNTPSALRAAYTDFEARLDAQRLGELPARSLAAEHFFDDAVYASLLRGECLPYGNGRAALIEFTYDRLPVALRARFFDLRARRVRPVIAHPERYEAFHRDPERASDELRRAGGVLLLDVAALDGKYGSKPQRAAEELVDLDAYYAACSDAHRASDVEAVARGIERLLRLTGREGVTRLLRDGPREILEGRILDEFD